MAPTRKKARASNTSESSLDMNSFPEPPSQTMSTKIQTPVRTPTSRSPIKKARIQITANQKQALIDNLQLEITERARKLRAQYVMQAQGLRTRVELRVNRIPTALRKVTMGELILKYSETVEKQPKLGTGQSYGLRPTAATPRKNLLQQTQSRSRQSPSPMRPAKTISETTDKENDDLLDPKKRGKATAAPERIASHKLVESQVLSPRSANSRTLPQSPIRTANSPPKSFLARPIGSPLKPMAPGLTGGATSMLQNMVEKAKNSRVNTTRKVTASSSGSSSAGVGRGKRQPAAPTVEKTGRGRVSAGSQSSDASSGTVIQKKAAPAKRTVMGTIKGAVQKKATVTKTAAPAPTGRVLRKRT